MNPQMLLQMLMGGGDPQSIAMSILQNNAKSGNPMASNLINLIQSGRTNDIETIARNMMREQGKDFDKEFAQFKKMFGR